MNTTDLLNQIKKNLQKKKTEIATDMVDGRMSDFNSYHKYVGLAQGFEEACGVIDYTLKQINEGDE